MKVEEHSIASYRFYVSIGASCGLQVIILSRNFGDYMSHSKKQNIFLIASNYIIFGLDRMC